MSLDSRGGRQALCTTIGYVPRNPRATSDPRATSEPRAGSESQERCRRQFMYKRSQGEGRCRHELPGTLPATVHVGVSHDPRARTSRCSRTSSFARARSFAIACSGHAADRSSAHAVDPSSAHAADRKQQTACAHTRTPVHVHLGTARKVEVELSICQPDE